MTDASQPPAGWYKDPGPEAPAGQQRWWDGTKWSEHVQAAAAPAAPAAPTPEPVAAPAPPVPVFEGAPGPATAAAPAAPSAPPFPTAAEAPGFYNPYNAEVDARRGKNTPATAALVIGICSIVLTLLAGAVWVVPVLIAVAAIVWGIVGIRRASSSGVGKVKSIWGLSLGGASVAIVILALIGIAAANSGANLSYDKAKIEKTLIDGIQKQTGQTVTMSCPTDPPMSVGYTFQCVATEATGQNHFVNVKIQDEAGDITWQVKD